jgi:hypothetical protein
MDPRARANGVDDVGSVLGGSSRRRDTTFLSNVANGDDEGVDSRAEWSPVF